MATAAADAPGSRSILSPGCTPLLSSLTAPSSPLPENEAEGVLKWRDNSYTGGSGSSGDAGKIGEAAAATAMLNAVAFAEESVDGDRGAIGCGTTVATRAKAEEEEAVVVVAEGDAVIKSTRSGENKSNYSDGSSKARGRSSTIDSAATSTTTSSSTCFTSRGGTSSSSVPDVVPGLILRASSADGAISPRNNNINGRHSKHADPSKTTEEAEGPPSAPPRSHDVELFVPPMLSSVYNRGGSRGKGAVAAGPRGAFLEAHLPWGKRRRMSGKLRWKVSGGSRMPRRVFFCFLRGYGGEGILSVSGK